MTRLSSVDLADYKYYDMHVVIERALKSLRKNLLNDTRKRLISLFSGLMVVIQSLSSEKQAVTGHSQFLIWGRD